MRALSLRRFVLLAAAAPALALISIVPASAHPNYSRPVATSGTFAQPAAAEGAFTYDLSQVPSGARAWVLVRYLPDGRTLLFLALSGLLPRHEYGSHAHSRACGATGADAGPHFQFRQDPVVPSVDPAYANPSNEIWLDFTTDRHGRGWAVAVQSWQPTADRRPGSVVIHQEHTHDGTDGPAGTAGARLACLTVKF